jgi:hypothetical protein
VLDRSRRNQFNDRGREIALQLIDVDGGVQQDRGALRHRGGKNPPVSNLSMRTAAGWGCAYERRTNTESANNNAVAKQANYHSTSPKRV